MQEYMLKVATMNIPINAVVVTSPQGDNMIVSEVVLERPEGGTEVWRLTHEGVALDDNEYVSLSEAMERNSRVLTQAHEQTFATTDEAKALVGTFLATTPV